MKYMHMISRDHSEGWGMVKCRLDLFLKIICFQPSPGTFPKGGEGGSEVPSSKVSCFDFSQYNCWKNILKWLLCINFRIKKLCLKFQNPQRKFLDWKWLPSPLEVFRKFIRFGTLTRPLPEYQIGGGKLYLILQGNWYLPSAHPCRGQH